MQLLLPAVINEYPVKKDLVEMSGIRHVSIALRVARNIYIRCRLAEAQNWKCCWCGDECIPESDTPKSATIEHVQPRSQGGADEWENYAMACAECNHRRGTLSVEDFMAGRFPKPKPNKASRLANKALAKYIKKAQERNQNGWVREDGTPLCRQEWLDSLRISCAKRDQLSEIVFGEENVPA